MNIQETMKTLMCMPPHSSIFIGGCHGKGKSELVAQAAAKKSLLINKPFGLIDLRLSQYEIGDLIGIPRSQSTFTINQNVYKKGQLENVEVLAKNVTVHDLPIWFPQDPNTYGYLFFDELTRATPDIQNWALQIVLDYRSNFTNVSPGWDVIAAGNLNRDVYNNIHSMDHALRDRFFFIDFNPTVPEWESHAETIKVHKAIRMYISRFPNDLDPPEQMNVDTRYPSRRSWVKFSNALLHMESINEKPLEDSNYLILLAKGFVGSSVAINFVEYIKKNYKVYQASEILTKFSTLKEAFSSMPITDITYYNKEIIKYISENIPKELTPKQGKNLLLYIQTIPQEASMGFWSDFSTSCKYQSVNWYKSSEEIEAFVTNTFKKVA
jgi:hypothetical protein